VGVTVGATVGVLVGRRRFPGMKWIGFGEDCACQVDTQTTWAGLEVGEWAVLAPLDHDRQFAFLCGCSYLRANNRMVLETFDVDEVCDVGGDIVGDVVVMRWAVQGVV